MLRNHVVWAHLPLYLSGWIPSRQCALLSFSSGRSTREKGSSPVPQGWWEGLLHAVREDHTPKDPKGSLSFHCTWSSSSSLLGSSNGVRGRLIGSLEEDSIAAASCSEERNPLPASWGWVSMWDGGWVGGQVGTPLCLSSSKLILGRVWFLSPSSLRASWKHSNLFPQTRTLNQTP